MGLINGAIIETNPQPDTIANIGVFDEADWDYLESVWQQFEPTRYIKKMSELLPPDGYTGPIWLGAVKDENGRWYDPTWATLTPEQQSAYLESAK